MAETVVFQQPVTGSEPPAPVAAPTSPDTPADRPAWLPENFKSVDDFVKSYNDTKAELTRVQQKAKEPVSSEPEPKQDKTENPLEIDVDAQKTTEDKVEAEIAKRLNVEEYQAEFTKTSDLSPESRQAIADKLKDLFGDDARSLVDDYVEGAKNRVQNFRQSAFDIAGGQDKYTEMVQWAQGNLSPAEIETYNRQVNSNDFTTVSFAIEALKSKFTAANGSTPNLIQGDSVASSGAFQSLFEMKQAMADPRYAKDPAYRESVIARVAMSNL